MIELSELPFLFLVVVAFAAVHRLYGWRGTATAAAPVLLMSAVALADQFGWVNVDATGVTQSAAIWWIVLAVVGIALGMTVPKPGDKNRG